MQEPEEITVFFLVMSAAFQPLKGIFSHADDTKPAACMPFIEAAAGATSAKTILVGTSCKKGTS
jgi:hypothetical protein